MGEKRNHPKAWQDGRKGVGEVGDQLRQEWDQLRGKSDGMGDLSATWSEPCRPASVAATSTVPAPSKADDLRPSRAAVRGVRCRIFPVQEAPQLSTPHQ